MSQEQATMTLPLDLVKPAIEAQVQAAVIKALGSVDGLIEQMVSRILNEKVDDNGRPSNYNSAVPWLTRATHEIVKQSIQDGIRAHMGEHAEKIKAAIDAEMRKSKSPLVQALVASMAEGISRACTDNYRLSISFNH